MGTLLASPQGKSGKQNLSHYILWLNAGRKSRESSGLLESRINFFQYRDAHGSIAFGIDWG